MANSNWHFNKNLKNLRVLKLNYKYLKINNETYLLHIVTKMKHIICWKLIHFGWHQKKWSFLFEFFI